MPDRTQEIKNLRQVFTASVNYTDEKIKKVYYDIGHNDISTEDHTNELAYQITAPAGAKLLQLQAIGGNTVKLSPSVASDSTKAMIKTMPSVVYTFDGSKFYGDSEVSENLIVLEDKVSTTINGITYSITNGVITLSGTASAWVSITLFSGSLSGTYTFKDFGSGTSTASNNIRIAESGSYTKFIPLGNQTTATDINAIQFYCEANTTLTNVVIKPMLVKGTTAPSEFKAGYEGIHNLELTGLKVEGENLIGLQDVAQTTTNGITYSVTNGVIKMRGTSTTNSNRWFNLLQTIQAQNVYVYFTFVNRGTYEINNNSCWLSKANADYTNRFQAVNGIKSLSYSLSALDVYIPNGQSIDVEIYPMLVRGSVAPTTYAPYVSQTLPIDLTSIEDSGGNKLFADGKLRLGDYITPYSQLKGRKQVETNDGWNYGSNGAGTLYIISQKYTATTTTDIISTNKVVSQYAWWNMETPSEITVTFDINSGGLVIIPPSDLQTVANIIPQCNIEALLRTPLTSNTDLSATLRNIQGYPNGSIIAENTHNMDVESVITYNSIIQETLCPSVTVEGFNVWNEEWGNYHWVNGIRTTYATGVGCKNPISVKTGETYYFKRPSGVNAGYVYLDSNENLVGNGEQYLISGNNTLTIPSGVSYLCFWLNNYGAIYNHDICINISNAELNGTYKPHKDTITRNLPTITSDGWSAGTQRNYRVFCDDEGNAVNKRYTNVDKDDLGNYNYTYESSWGAGADFYINSVDTPTMKKPSDNDTSANVMSPNYTNVSRNTMYNNSTDMVMSLLTGGAFKFRNNLYDNATIFKTAMTNEPLYFEYDDASKTETDMDDFDFFFDVEEGDVITFNNTYAQQVYATYSFLIKEAKSNE